MWLRVFIASLVCVGAACSDQTSTDEPFPSERPYANLTDFDTSGCRTTEPVDLYGIWHFALVGPDDARGTIAVRLGPDVPRRENLWSEAGEPAGWIGGTQANRLLFGDGVLVRVQRYQPGRFIAWTIFGCSRDDSDRLDGQYVLCIEEECETYEATGYRVTTLDEAPAHNLELLSQFEGNRLELRPLNSIWINVRYRDGYAYVVRRDALFVVDVRDPTDPIEVGRAPLTKGNDVKLTVGDDGRLYALTSSDLTGIHVFDVSDPTRPTEVHRFALEYDPVREEFYGAHTLFIEGNRVYITQDGVKVFDISQPGTPEFLGRYYLPTQDGYVHDMYVEDGIVYLNYWGDGLVVVDMNDPALPQKLGQFEDYDNRTSHSNWVTRAGGRLVSVHGDETVGAHVRIIDVDPASPEFMTAIGSYQTQPGVSVHNIQAHGELAFVTYYQDGLRVLDLSDPTAPVEVAHYRTWQGPSAAYGQSIYEGAIGIDYDVDTRTAYVVDTHLGLLVLRLDEKLEPGATGCGVHSAAPGVEGLLVVLLGLLLMRPRRRGRGPRSGVAIAAAAASHPPPSAVDTGRTRRSTRES